MNEARDALRSSLKRRKEISIEENDTQYKDIDTKKLFADGNSYELYAVIAKLMDRNRAQVKEIKNLKLEQESQKILLCEVIEQKKKAIEDKAIIEEDKRIFGNRLKKKSIELSRISNMQLDTLRQMINAHHELNVKDIEITTLKLQNEQLQNDLQREDFFESFNKPNEAIKYFEQLLKSPRSSKDTSRLGYTSNQEGESSKATKERNNKGKNSKPTCHHCGKKGHATNVCRSKNDS